MKKILLSAALIAASFTTVAQVGVGTTAPSAALDVVSTGTDNTTKALEINNSTGELVTVLDDGKVGIGTDAPSQTLHLKSTGGVFVDRFAASGAFTILRGARGTMDAPIALTNAEQIGYVQGRAYNGTDFSTTGSVISFYSKGDQSPTNAGSGITFSTVEENTTSLSLAMRINDKGDVGIDKSLPVAKLDVNGYVKLGSTDTTADLALTSGLIRYNSGLQYHDGTDWNTLTAAKFIDGTLATDAVYNDGNVGIGTSTPEAYLHIRGTATTSPNIILRSRSVNSSFTGNIFFQERADTGMSIGYDGVADTFNFTERRSGVDTILMTLSRKTSATGNLGIGTTTPGTKLAVVGLPEFANEAAAASLSTGDFYRTAAGVVMVKL